MRVALRYICLLAALAILAGCAHTPQSRPDRYAGGQYYGDAIHARDLPPH